MAKKKLAIFIAAIVILIFVFFPNFSKYRKLSMECKGLRTRIEELKAENKRLEEEKYKLANDIEYIEKRAREKLGVVKKDEIPYKIIEE
ncbi:MAG: septum formation initiator family protein [Candidatus Omnitrophica bacterium]|nr:septum formation initiator family protein [Candidatus Omnitrophota bacterium]